MAAINFSSAAEHRPARRALRLCQQLVRSTTAASSSPEGLAAFPTAFPFSPIKDSWLKVSRLHPALGARVEGLDLKKPLSPEEVWEINRVWGEADGILVFAGQHLSAAELKAFSAQFGHVLQHPFQNPKNARYAKETKAAAVGESLAHVADHDDALAAEEVMTISGKADMWHTDMTWMKHPPKATILQCVQRDESLEAGGSGIGGSRGDTLFCSMTKAYEQLSPGLQKSLETMTCRHGVQDLMGKYEAEDAEKEYPNGLGVLSRIENEHPAVILHPVTGKKSMYVNNWPCKRFTGMSQEETAPLKRHLNSVATQEKNVYRHQWQVGDLVMIDQRCTMHCVVRDFDAGKQCRVMQRATITDMGNAPGIYHQPRPVGVTGQTGPEMSSSRGMRDCGGTPRTYRENVTMLPGSYDQRIWQPFSDRPPVVEEAFAGLLFEQR